MAENNNQSLEQFLGGIEKRAFRMAEISTSNRDDALELVQEAMIKLVQKYASRPENEWRPLFYRILRSKITDWHRRQQVRRKVMAVSHWFRGDDDSEYNDVIAQSPGDENEQPVEKLNNEQINERIVEAIKQLPARQQQAFMFRAWEGLSVADTAQAMGCSDGSVKTHYSRATRALQNHLTILRPVD